MVYTEYPLAADQRGGTLWSGSLSLKEVCQEQHVTLGGCFCSTERWLTSSVKKVGDATLGKEQSWGMAICKLLPKYLSSSFPLHFLPSTPSLLSLPPSFVLFFIPFLYFFIHECTQTPSQASASVIFLDSKQPLIIQGLGIGCQLQICATHLYLQLLKS